MKKLFLSAAVLAMIVSCSKNQDVQMPQGDAIGFSTLNNRVTKVANTNDDLPNSSYQVYANTTGETSWLINEEMLSTDDYKSGNIYYWPVGKTVDFYAYAPFEDDALVAGTVSTTSIPLTFTVPAEADIDFTVAAPVLATTSDATPATDGKGKVNLKFAHMLSKASFSVALETSIANNHKFVFSGVDFNVDTKGINVNAVTGDQSLVDGSATYPYNFTSNTTKATSFNASNELYFVPQKGSGCSITLKDVVITTQNDNIVFSGDLTYDLDDTQIFEQGKAYNFVVTVNNLLKITFASTEATWDNGGDVTLK